MDKNAWPARTHETDADRAWKPVVDDGARVVVEYPEYFFDGTSRSRSFEFEGSDKMREVGDARPRTWVRVKDAQ